MVLGAVADAWVRAGRGRSRADAVWVTDRIFALVDGTDDDHRSGTEALRQVRRLLRPMANPRDVAGTLRAVNFALWSEGSGGVASTITLAVWLGSYLVVGHIGDSRAYLVLRGGEVHVLTTDHGDGMDDDRVLRFGMRQASPVPQLMLRRVLAGDRLVLCTDGLWRTIVHRELLRVATCLANEAVSMLRCLVPTGDDDRETSDGTATARRSREAS